MASVLVQQQLSKIDQFLSILNLFSLNTKEKIGVVRGK
jgi:hypothetical protein